MLVRCVWRVQASGVLHLLCSGCVCSALARGINSDAPCRAWQRARCLRWRGCLVPAMDCSGIKKEHLIWITTKELET